MRSGNACSGPAHVANSQARSCTCECDPLASTSAQSLMTASSDYRLTQRKRQHKELRRQDRAELTDNQHRSESEHPESFEVVPVVAPWKA